ncbi:hypothetical protein OMCYN_01371 [cyanobiont of Ornithocercus magnificus]|nr:hypothetical protein OMCYN_01371 [cyanobiont of Ornithocercus magnificus]
MLSGINLGKNLAMPRQILLYRFRLNQIVVLN